MLAGLEETNGQLGYEVTVVKSGSLVHKLYLADDGVVPNLLYGTAEI
jgi:hypothetical protein